MSVYLMAYSALLRLASPSPTEQELRNTADYTKNEMRKQIEVFNKEWPHLRG